MAPRSLLLAAACGGCRLLPALAAWQLEDATALLQADKPRLFGGLLGGAGSEDEENSNTGGMSGLLRTLALGAEAEDGSMAKMLNSAKDLMEGMEAKTPEPTAQGAASDEGLDKMANSLQTWGAKMQHMFDNAKAQGSTPGDLLSGVGRMMSKAVPPEVRERAEKVRARASKAKEKLAGLTNLLRNPNPHTPTPEELTKAKDAAEKLGAMFKKHLEQSAADPSSRTGQKIKDIVDLFRESEAESAADKNPLSGINELASGIRQALHLPEGNPVGVPETPAVAPLPAAAVQQPAMPMPQQAAPPQPLAAMQPQQWGPPPPQAWQQQPYPPMQQQPMGPMAYPMAPPMMQQQTPMMQQQPPMMQQQPPMMQQQQQPPTMQQQPPMGGMQPYQMPQMR